MSEQMRTMRSKELPKELRDRIVARHRSGQGYNRTSAALKVPKSTVASVILKWNKFGTSRILPRPGSRPAKLLNHGRRASVREVKKNPEITVAELQRLTQPLPGTAPTGHSPTGHSPYRAHPYRTQPLPDTALPDTAPTGHSPTGHTPTGHSPYRAHPYRAQPLPGTPLPDTAPTGHTPTGHSPTGHTPTGHSPTGHSPNSPAGHSPTAIGRWEKVPQSQLSLRPSTSLGLVAERPDRSLSSVQDI